jgi:hypothetical protein
MTWIDLLRLTVCGLPVFVWLIILGLGFMFISAMDSAIDSAPRGSRRPPAHPPGYNNIKKKGRS